MGEKDYAIVVGITRYPALGNLDGPVRDANDFYEWLIHPRGGNVKEANITRILTSDPPEPGRPRPQRYEVDDALDDLYDIGMEKSVVGDRLYFYFAGHGFATSIQDAALWMANAAAGKPGYNVSGRPYADWFRTAAFFKEVVLFMDCCRESYTATRTEPPYKAVRANKAALRYYGFATQWSRSTREGPWGPDGETRGIFTLTLLDALRKLKPDENGQISGSRLAGYVIATIKKDPRVPKSQPDEENRPDFDYDPDPDYDLKFNAPFGEPPSNPLKGGDALQDLEGLEAMPAPAAGYVVRLTLMNGDAGRQFRLLTNDKTEIPPLQQTAAEWVWRVDAPGLYSMILDTGESKPIQILNNVEVINDQLR